MVELVLHDSSMMDWVRGESFKIVSTFPKVEVTGDLPLVLVDISDLKTTGANYTNEYLKNYQRGTEYTPREDLLNLLQAIAKLHPRAIGFDIDFSPEEDFQPSGQGSFLDACADQTKGGIPVFLAISRNAAMPPRAWLRGDEYTNLAACGLRFPGDNTRMFSTIACAPDHPPLKSLAQAMADAYKDDGPPVMRGPISSWLYAVRSLVINLLVAHEENVSIGGGNSSCQATSFLVNYNFLPLLLRDDCGPVSAEEILSAETDDEKEQYNLEKLKARFKGKTILIGDAKPGASYDTAIIPGRPDPLPALYTHACAICTLIKSPLKQVGLFPGILLTATVTLMLLVLNYLQWVRYFLNPRYWFTRMLAKHLKGLRLDMLHIILAMVIVTGLAVFMATCFHILWLTFIASWAVFCAEFYCALYINNGKHPA